MIAATDLTVLVIGVREFAAHRRRGPADHAQADASRWPPKIRELDTQAYG